MGLMSCKCQTFASPGLPEPCCCHVKDILRLTLAVHTISLMIKCAVAVRKGMAVMSVKNRLGSRATRDILMIVRLPCGTAIGLDQAPPFSAYFLCISRPFDRFWKYNVYTSRPPINDWMLTFAL